jgi:intracellular sulfur oxidation DsrE/DsrF family protein
MKQLLGFVLAGGLLLVMVYVLFLPGERQQGTAVTAEVLVEESVPAVEITPEVEALPEKAVLDISVHTIEGLKVLFDRAEQLAMMPRAKGEDASLVLVLHGPEVDFFSIKNYHKYKDIVDQAARLDAFDVVDVRICQTMIGARGIEPMDIPSFIEQVPYGPGEVERLKQQGYVAF